MASEVKDEHNSKSEHEDENTDDKIPQEGEASTKDDIKDSGRNKSKEDSGKEESDDNDDDEEEVGLLDRPVEVSGCRARKKVERLEVSFSTPKEKQEFVEGKGKKLGDCPRIEMQIQKIKVPDLKPLHKIIFNRTGAANEIRKNIRKFSGFPFEKDSAEYNRRKMAVEKMKIPALKQACLVLDLERGGSKEDIISRIMSFLIKPEDSGKSVPSKKKPAKEKKKGTAKAEKKIKSGKKVKAGKDKESKDEQVQNMDDDDSTNGEASMGGTDEENEAERDEPKPKSKEKKVKAKPKAQEKKQEKPKTAKRKIEVSSDESSSEQPVAKKANKMPSDEEITKLVKQILESADLQEITMKKVIKQVSDAYPDFDLTHKKTFIKSTIKSVIS